MWWEPCPKLWPGGVTGSWLESIPDSLLYRQDQGLRGLGGTLPFLSGGGSSVQQLCRAMGYLCQEAVQCGGTGRWRVDSMVQLENLKKIFPLVLPFLPPSQDIEVSYYHTYLDGVDFVFVDASLYHHVAGNIYGGSREVLSPLPLPFPFPSPSLSPFPSLPPLNTFLSPPERRRSRAEWYFSVRLLLR